MAVNAKRSKSFTQRILSRLALGQLLLRKVCFQGSCAFILLERKGFIQIAGLRLPKGRKQIISMISFVNTILFAGPLVTWIKIFSPEIRLCFWSHIYHIYVCYVYGHFVSMHTCVPCIYLLPVEGNGSFRTGIADGWESPCRCWESNTGLLMNKCSLLIYLSRPCCQILKSI